MHKTPKSLHQPSEVQSIRCAIYARYSDDNQRRSSIEDQIRQCREGAERNGWTVLDQYIKSDEAKTGQVLLGRPGLEELVQLASAKPRPFDCILIDDTSRFGRNLSDTLPLTDQLEFAGVFLYFVSTSLDQRDPNFRTLYISYGQQDERFSKALGEKVFRGQVGRVRAGFTVSGKTYGYKNVPIESTTRIGSYGRPMVDAVTLEIIPKEAAIVKRIFKMYVSGLGFYLIAKTLNEEGIPPTSVGHKRSRNVWNAVTIKNILRNERYNGVSVWNKTRSVRNPKTQKMTNRKKPESEWIRHAVPEWRIVPEDLWKAKCEEMERRAKASRKKGGQNRTEQSRRHIFSGLMRCALCGGAITIVSGSHPHNRYGCLNARQQTSCQNRVSIRRTDLEAQLIAALTKKLTEPENRQMISREFRKQLREVWDAQVTGAEGLAVNRKEMERTKQLLKDQARNLVEAIAYTGGSPQIFDKLKTLDRQMADIEAKLASPVEVPPLPSEAETERFLARSLDGLCKILLAEPEVARQQLNRYIGQLVLHPVFSLDRNGAYEVRGDVALFANEQEGDEAVVMLERSVNRTTQHYNNLTLHYNNLTLPFSAVVTPTRWKRNQVAA